MRLTEPVGRSAKPRGAFYVREAINREAPSASQKVALGALYVCGAIARHRLPQETWARAKTLISTIVPPITSRHAPNNHVRFG
jgi:hypothetical protein